jgi:hypothetical protein
MDLVELSNRAKLHPNADENYGEEINWVNRRIFFLPDAFNGDSAMGTHMI